MRLSRDQSGATAIEFAIVAIPFFIFIFGILQVALYYFSTQALDLATRVASRQIMTGQVSSAGMTADKFKTQVLCKELVVPLDCSKITVSVSKVGKESSKLDKPGIYAFLNASATGLLPANLNSSVGTFCTGGSRDYIFIDVAYKFQSFFNFTGGQSNKAQDDNFWILRSTNFIYNEPLIATAGC